jgi:outer membrane receptor for ferrienterochelin and colicins
MRACPSAILGIVRLVGGRKQRRSSVLLTVMGLTANLVIAATPGAADLAQRLDPIVVTGTRTAQRLSETPIRTEVLGATELRLAAPRYLADAIELLPGARVENNCQNCGTSEILLLGLDQKYTQILFDGAPLFSGLAGVYGIEQIPAVFIDRIEVVKGGGSSIYGSGAVGGVINIIGRRPERSGGIAEFRFDRVHGEPGMSVSVAADAVSADGRTLASGYGQVARADPADLNRDGFSDLTKRKLEVVGARFAHRTKAGELRADYNRTVEFRRGGNKFELPDPLADISERIDTRRDAATLAWTSVATANFDYQIGTGFAGVDRETFYGGLFGRGVNEHLVSESAPGAGDNDQPFIDRGYTTAGEVARDQFGFTKNWVWNLDVQANLRWGRHLTSVGAQYYREKIDDIVPVSPFVADYPAARDLAVGDNLGAFVQDEWRFTESWALVLGLRADRNSELSGAVFSPRFNVRWSPSEHFTMRATFGTGFRAPQAFDEDLHVELIAGSRTKTRQAASLAQEKSRSTLVSAEYQPEFANGKLALEATAFLTRIRGTFTNSEVQTDPVTGDSFRLRYNGPGAEVGGVELNIGSLPLPKLRVDLGWVAQFARFSKPVVVFDDGAGRVVAERDFLETPRHYGVLQLNYSEPRFAEVGITAIYTGRMKDINQRTGELNARTRDFLVWSATVSRRFATKGFPAVTFAVGMKNIFDSRQRDLETGVNRDPYYLYGPRTPRTVFASVRTEF